MKKKDTLQKINKFLYDYFPNVNGVLLFGSASLSQQNFEDIDLLIIDEKFSYVAKENFYYDRQQFGIIKIPLNDIFNILAHDFKNGIYKHIFETGFIIKDELKILKNVKQYICKDYPDNCTIIRFNINSTIFKINQCFNSLKGATPLIESYLNLSDCINYIIDFIILLDGKIHFKSTKHKTRYLYKYHPQYAVKVAGIVEVIKNKRITLFRIEELMKLLAIPREFKYNNDFLDEHLSESDPLIFYIPNADPKEIKRIKEILNQHNLIYYIFYIDTNNIEEAGIYIFVSCKIENKIASLRNSLKEYLGERRMFFPYNFSFNNEIKFGAFYSLLEELFIEIQPIINSIEADVEKTAKFINTIIKQINLTFEELSSYYFYKTINNFHNLTFKEIADKEKKYKMTYKNTKDKTILSADTDLFDLRFDFAALQPVPKFFLLQIIDRILSMFILKDKEKFEIVDSLRNNHFTNV
ncbi:hypothetical protein DRF65_20635 [Chryseobacterium pennae]|uniref:Nucleotidyltransferase domain-containing protein n=1 Tax=Chryseobacterium pennae TaxID=2258962 RepID=A0A3D9C3M9_9FLAO|nr:hypothetical protein [Chryseobacterium pennae]REC60473.1 hypothetical protein DRF65_20635 [Chryseobacterium pennae]